jgi:hypothetical protein
VAVWDPNTNAEAMATPLQMMVQRPGGAAAPFPDKSFRAADDRDRVLVVAGRAQKECMPVTAKARP